MTLPLQRYRILNTRPSYQASAISKALRAEGAEVIEYPMIDIKPTQAWQKTTCAVDDFNLLIFTSMHAVDYFFKKHPYDMHMKPIIAIGQGTANALMRYHLHPIQPTEAHSEALLQLPILQHITHQKIALIKGLGGRRLIETTLRQRGAFMSIYHVYRRILPEHFHDTAPQYLQQHYDIILITSVTSLKHLCQYVLKQTLETSLFIVLSPRIALYAQRVGCRHVIICPYDRLIEKLKEYHHAHSNP